MFDFRNNSPTRDFRFSDRTHFAIERIWPPVLESPLKPTTLSVSVINKPSPEAPPAARSHEKQQPATTMEQHPRARADPALGPVQHPVGDLGRDSREGRCPDGCRDLGGPHGLDCGVAAGGTTFQCDEDDDEVSPEKAGTFLEIRWRRHSGPSPPGRPLPTSSAQRQQQAGSVAFLCRREVGPEGQVTWVSDHSAGGAQASLIPILLCRRQHHRSSSMPTAVSSGPADSSSTWEGSQQPAIKKGAAGHHDRSFYAAMRLLPTPAPVVVSVVSGAASKSGAASN